eukprot:s4067_g2.t1
MPRPAVYKSKLCRVTRDDDDDSGAKGCRQLWARCCFAEGLSSFPDMSGRGCVQCAETVTCMWHYSDPSAFVRAPPMFVQSASEHLHEIAEVAGFVYTLWAKEDATGPEGDEEEQGSKNTKNSKKNKQKKKEIKKSNKESEKGNRDSNSGDAEEPHAITRMKRTMAPDCAYVPGSYKEARLRYIKRKREKGWSWKEACQKWNASAIRGSWLEGLSTNELKRRRFI